MASTPQFRKEDRYGDINSLVHAGSPETPGKKVYDRTKSPFRWLVLFLSCFAMFGSYYCYDIPAATNKAIKAWLNIDPSGYNRLYEVYSYPNMILPLFGGVIVDRIGANKCIFGFLAILVLGQTIFALGLTYQNYTMCIIGRIVFGLGGESLTVAMSTLLAVWFKGKEMALAMGLNLSVARLGSVLNNFASAALQTHYNEDAAGWGGLALLDLCLVLIVVMIVMDHQRNTKLRKQGYTLEKIKNDERFRCSDIATFEVRFWLITLSCLIVYACVLPFNNIAKGFLETKFDMETTKPNGEVVAKHIVSLIQSVPYIISGVASPFLGGAVDIFGKRAWLLLGASATTAGAHALLGLTTLYPAVGLSLLGCSYAVYAAAMWPAIALVVEEERLGTAYGLVTAVQNSGLALTPMVIGLLLGPSTFPTTDRYNHVELFLMGLGLFSILIAILLLIFDKRRGGDINRPGIADKTNIFTMALECLGCREAPEKRTGEEAPLLNPSNPNGQQRETAVN